MVRAIDRATRGGKPMRLHAKGIAVLVLGIAGPVFGGGTKLQMNIIASPPDCSVAGCLNSAAACADLGGNTDCVANGVSSKSKVSIDGNLLLKANLSGVLTNSGTPASTGAEGAVDNYVLQMGLQTCTVDVIEIPYCSAPQDVYLKVVLAAGKGKLKVDLKRVFPSFGVGSAFRVNHVALITPRAGGNCLGTNSTVDITSRLNDATCNDGVGILGVGGVALQ